MGVRPVRRAVEAGARGDAQAHEVVSRGERPNVARGLSWALSGQWTAQAVQIVTTMVLARLLSPDDFGVFAMATAFTVIVDQFRVLGLSQAAVQRQDLTWGQVSNLFWINVAAGGVLSAVVAGGGFLLAAFYGEPRLVGICLALSGGYILSGLAAQHGALLTRRMRFRSIAVRNVVSGALASLVGVSAALLGLGVWSLVVQQLAMVTFSTIAVWLAVDWRPRRPQDLRGTLPLVSFGAHVTVANLFHTIARQADNFIVGRMLGAAELGYYSRAYGLLTMPLRQLRNPLTYVMVPALSALQDEPERYRSLYVRATGGVAQLGAPAIVIAVVTAPDLIWVFLGDQWVSVVPIFRLLAIAGVVQLISTTTGWLFISSSRVGAYSAWAAVSSVLTVASFVVGVRWGLEGVALAYALGQVLLTLPAFLVACRGTPVRVSDPLTVMLRPGLVAVLVGAAAFGVARTVGWMAPLPALLLTAGAGLGAWAGVVLLWRGLRVELISFVRALRAKVPPA